MIILSESSIQNQMPEKIYTEMEKWNIEQENVLELVCTYTSILHEKKRLRKMKEKKMYVEHT